MADKWKIKRTGKDEYDIEPPSDDGCSVGIIAAIFSAIVVAIITVWENKKARRICLAVLGVLLSISVIYAIIRPIVDPFYNNPLAYSLSDNGEYYSVCEVLDSKASNIEIPATINGKPVKHISDSAFKDCESLTGVIIPNGILSIGSSAFEGCKSLTSVVIPNSVTSIGDSAFVSCNSLTNIVIPDSVTNIGESVFVGCGSLTNVVLPNNINSIPKNMFYLCASLKEITIPDSVTSINKGAFAFCKSLTSVTIPESVNYIGEISFANIDSTITFVYLGTMSQWEAIEKVVAWDVYGSLDWNSSTYNYTISCTDGNISN